MRNQIRRFDVTFVVDEPDAEPGQDLCDVSMLIGLLDEVGYDVQCVEVPNGNGTLFIRKRKDPT
jgi:hypothetical protein